MVARFRENVQYVSLKRWEEVRIKEIKTNIKIAQATASSEIKEN